MADKTYMVAIGVVQQFKDKPVIREREANGKTVRDVTIKTFTGQKLLSITIWPELQIDTSTLKRGDLIWVDGEFSSYTYQAADGSPREGMQISASSLGTLAAVPRAAREVVQATVTAAAAASEVAPF